MDNTEKSLSPYRYEQPLKLSTPEWSTDHNGANWNPGGYGNKVLPAGVYDYQTPWMQPPYLRRVGFVGDSMVDLPDDPTSEVLAHIKDFWSKEPAFRELGITFKRGIILYGPPGGGKTATIFRLAKELESQNAVMLVAQSAQEATAAIEMVKVLEPKRKIVVVLEDLDGIVNRYGDEALTHLLDGGTDVDSVLFLATTNYPERLPNRILNRPSRFDVRMRIGMPSTEARRVYIEHVVKGNLLVEIDELVEKTAGLGIAAIKEVIILTQIFEHTVDEAVDKVKNTNIQSDDYYEEEDYKDFDTCSGAYLVDVDDNEEKLMDVVVKDYK